MADDVEVSPGIKASGVLTFALAKGAAAFGGYQLARGEKEVAYAAGGVALVAESNFLRAVPSVTGILVDAAIFSVVYFSQRGHSAPTKSNVGITSPDTAGKAKVA